MGEMNKPVLGFHGKREEEGMAVPKEPRCKAGHQRYRRHEGDLASGPVASACCSHTQSAAPDLLGSKGGLSQSCMGNSEAPLGAVACNLGSLTSQGRGHQRPEEIRTNGRKSLDS